MFIPSPVPTIPSVPATYGYCMVVPSDPEAISRIVDVLLARSGMSLAEAARRLGVANQSLHQYKKGKRKKTSLQWLQRLTEICGAKILIEMPPDRLGDRL